MKVDPLSRRTLLRLSLGVWALPQIALADGVRVVTLFQGATDCAVALGVTPSGVVDSWSEKPMYRYLRHAVQGVAHVGLETQPSLEDIALLRPDVIVASRARERQDRIQHELPDALDQVTIAIEAGVSLDLKATGTLTIQGALVQIN